VAAVIGRGSSIAPLLSPPSLREGGAAVVIRASSPPLSREEGTAIVIRASSVSSEQRRQRQRLLHEGATGASGWNSVTETAQWQQRRGTVPLQKPTNPQRSDSARCKKSLKTMNAQAFDPAPSVSLPLAQKICKVMIHLSTVSLAKKGRETLLDRVLFSGKCVFTLLLFEPSFSFFFILTTVPEMHM
jgi:hypothetical protein